MEWWWKLPRKKGTMEIDNSREVITASASIDNCGFSIGDVVKHNGQDTSARRFGWVGTVKEIRLKQYRDGSMQVQLRVLYSCGIEQYYFSSWFSKYLRNLTKEKGMSNFIVWCPTQGNPKVRHETKQKAETEAKRLAAANPGSEFYVAELKSVSATATVQTRSL